MSYICAVNRETPVMGFICSQDSQMRLSVSHGHWKHISLYRAWDRPPPTPSRRRLLHHLLAQSWGRAEGLKPGWCLTGSCWAEQIESSSEKCSFRSHFIRQHLVSLLLPSGCQKACSEVLSLDVGSESHQAVGLHHSGCTFHWVGICRGSCAELLLSVSLPN